MQKKKTTRGRTSFQMAVYRDHRANMKNIVAKVDHSAPKLVASNYFTVGKLSTAMTRLHEVEKDTRNMLTHINQIYRTRGSVDCYNTNAFRMSNYEVRQVNNLYVQRDNEILYEMLKNPSTKYSKKEQLEDFAKKQAEMIKMSKYPEFYETDLIDPLEKWTICPTEEDENPERIFSMPSKRVKCFFDLEITGERKLGRMFIEIYRDYVPIAGENFLHFVRAETNGYKNSLIYRIKPKFGLIGGDVENRNGACTKTAYGRPFAHENHLLKFAGPGVVAAFTLMPGLNFCQFFISFKALPFLQNQFVVIGRVIENLRTLEMVEEFGNASGVPKKPIVIENCGIW